MVDASKVTHAADILDVAAAVKVIVAPRSPDTKVLYQTYIDPVPVAV
jgi:hypothetical protein